MLTVLRCRWMGRMLLYVAVLVAMFASSAGPVSAVNSSRFRQRIALRSVSMLETLQQHRRSLERELATSFSSSSSSSSRRQRLGASSGIERGRRAEPDGKRPGSLAEMLPRWITPDDAKGANPLAKEDSLEREAKSPFFNRPKADEVVFSAGSNKESAAMEAKINLLKALSSGRAELAKEQQMEQAAAIASGRADPMSRASMAKKAPDAEPPDERNDKKKQQAAAKAKLMKKMQEKMAKLLKVQGKKMNPRMVAARKAAANMIKRRMAAEKAAADRRAKMRQQQKQLDDKRNAKKAKELAAKDKADKDKAKAEADKDAIEKAKDKAKPKKANDKAKPENNAYPMSDQDEEQLAKLNAKVDRGLVNQKNAKAAIEEQLAGP